MSNYPTCFVGYAVATPSDQYSESGGYVNVHADGSCLNNGRNQPQAGIGVWWADNHPMNLSEAVTGPKATNIVAELQAVRKAAEIAYRNRITHLRIHTDSEFVIRVFKEWIFTWRRNGWLLGNNKPVENQGEIHRCAEALEKLVIDWNFVRGHSGNYGNNQADRLATAGAAKYRPHH